MAEAVTYADLRFVKAPLKKTISSQLEQDKEAYEEEEDGELTYENVQVPSVPAGAKGLASSGLGDHGVSLGAKAEPPATPWSSGTSLPAAWVLRCGVPCLQYSLLGLLITSLLLGVAAICLGVRYLQASRQLQQVNRVLEATNGSLRQQLHLKTAQLRQKEEVLQASRRELAQSQEALVMEEKGHQAAEEQLQVCQLDKEKTRQDLQREEQQRSALEQRLSSMRDTVKTFLRCTIPDSCCPVGWILNKRLCYYFSPTMKTWEESQRHCSSLSSKLATFDEIRSFYSQFPKHIRELLLCVGAGPYWIDPGYHKTWQQNGLKCMKVHSWQGIQSEKCTENLHYICQREALRVPDEDHSLHMSWTFMPAGACASLP